MSLAHPLRSILTIRPAFLPRCSPIPSFLRRAMSSNAQEFKQQPHRLLVIPGPIEVSDEVLYANAHPPVSHMAPDFARIFGDCLRMTRQGLVLDSSVHRATRLNKLHFHREVVSSKDAQPFLIAGSGTLGWDQVAANLIEADEDVLILKTGYFGDGFQDCLETYGAKVDSITAAEVGGAVSLDELEKALKAKKYKAVAFTHVDTSTAVLSDAKSIGETVKRLSPDTLVVLDGVCSVASEEIRMDAWGIDVVLTATQKGLGVPPGLSIVIASQKAIKVLESRSKPIPSYYASWKRWLPIMKSYENNTAAYFATPPVNLINAFYTSLRSITQGKYTLEERYALHKQASKRIKDAVAELGLKEVPLDPGAASNSMTAVYFPEGVTAADVVPELAKRDIIIAGGIHKSIKDKYFRIGHMGITVVDSERGDIDKVINALKETIAAAKSK